MGTLTGLVAPSLATVVIAWLLVGRVGGGRDASLVCAGIVFIAALMYYDVLAHRPGNEDMLGLPEAILIGAVTQSVVGAVAAWLFAIRRSTRHVVSWRDSRRGGGAA